MVVVCVADANQTQHALDMHFIYLYINIYDE